MSMVAVIHIEAGVAATLNAMTPIMILPVMTLVYKERISFRAYLGAAISVAGVVILMLSLLVGIKLKFGRRPVQELK